MHGHATHSRFILWKYNAVAIKEQNLSLRSNMKHAHNKKLKAIKKDV